MKDTTLIDAAAVTAWRISGTTGASASALVDQILTETSDGSYPRDADDFGRCERAMDMIPGLRARLPLMAGVNAYWALLVAEWDSIRSAPDRDVAIKAIIRPIETADPGVMRISDTMTMRIGGQVTFADEQFNTIAEAARKGRPPMKEDEDFRKHNQQAYSVAADELRAFIERAEQLAAEKADIADDLKEVFAEAKGRGYDIKVMKMVMALRKRDRDDVAEEEAILEMYKSALRMG